jgi:Flp pilus assembly protein TadG
MIRRNPRRGTAMLEFVLSGIPMIFVWIGIVQMSIGMWHYVVMQHAVKTAGNYLAHHGSSYVAAGNTASTIQDAANVLSTAAIGIPASEVSITWKATPITGSAVTTTCVLSACKTDATQWPPASASFPGSVVEIKADYVYKTSLAMFVPGKGTMRFNNPNLPGYTRQVILF